MRGTATTSVAPSATSSDTASDTGGAESSMNPAATRSSGASAATRSARAWNSAAPSAARVPCPTISRLGLAVIDLLAFVVEQGVEGGGGDRRPALGAAVGQAGQPAGGQGRLGLGGSDEPDRQPDHERRVGGEPQQLGQGGRRVAHHPDRPGSDLRGGEPKPGGRAGQP